MPHLRDLRRVSKTWNEIILRISNEWIQIRSFRSIDLTIRCRSLYPHANLFTKRIDLMLSPFPRERPRFTFPSTRRAHKALNNIGDILKKSINLKVLTVGPLYNYKDTAESQSNSWICELLDMIPNIASIEVIRFLSWTSYHLTGFYNLLPSFSNLRFIFVAPPFTIPVPPPPNLPNLDTLWIYGVSYNISTTEWFKEWKLPSLRHLTIILGYPMTINHMLSLLENNGNELVSLSLTDNFVEAADIPPMLWRSCPNLCRIQIHSNNLQPYLLTQRENMIISFIDRVCFVLPGQDFFPLCEAIKRIP